LVLIGDYGTGKAYPYEDREPGPTPGLEKANERPLPEREERNKRK
jgi:hypothetical protein